MRAVLALTMIFVGIALIQGQEKPAVELFIDIDPKMDDKDLLNSMKQITEMLLVIEYAGQDLEGMSRRNGKKVTLAPLLSLLDQNKDGKLTLTEFKKKEIDFYRLMIRILELQNPRPLALKG